MSGWCEYRWTCKTEGCANANRVHTQPVDCSIKAPEFPPRLCGACLCSMVLSIRTLVYDEPGVVERRQETTTAVDTSVMGLVRTADGRFDVTMRSHDVHACWAGEPARWGSGPTVDLAIRELLKTHPHAAERECVVCPYTMSTCSHGCARPWIGGSCWHERARKEMEPEGRDTGTHRDSCG